MINEKIWSPPTVDKEYFEKFKDINIKKSDLIYFLYEHSKMCDEGIKEWEKRNEKESTEAIEILTWKKLTYESIWQILEGGYFDK